MGARREVTAGLQKSGARCSHRSPMGVAALLLLLLLLSSLPVGVAWAAENDADELAKKLSNPVSSLISVPFQFNYDMGIGPDDEGQFLLNIQPVLPFAVGSKWTLIQRTIIPIINAPYDVGSGIGDVVLQSFFSPQPTPGGPIWGLGPVLSLPVASKDAFGTEKWSVGAAGVILRQAGPWTVGALAMNYWSVAGSDDRGDVNAGLYQPFLARSMGKGLSLSASMDAAANWKADDQWTIPLVASFSKVLRIGSQSASAGGGVKYFIEKPEGGPDWGVRANISLLFPK